MVTVELARRNGEEMLDRELESYLFFLFLTMVAVVWLAG